MENLLKEIKQIYLKYQFTSLERAIASIENILHEKYIDIVILGQFKAGKSSFLNHFIKNAILPTGVIPVTSVVTYLQFGKAEKAVVISSNNIKTEIPVSLIDEFISESKNPKNEKNVSVVDIELPCLDQFKGIRFVDTPGIGSVFQHNTDTTKNWFTEIGIAFITISAERPLGENEMVLIREISKHTPEIIILLTKVDLYNHEQIHEIRDYIERQLQKKFNRKFKIFNYSIDNNTEEYRKTIINEVMHPILSGFKDEHEKIVKHKVNSLAESCLTYLDIAYKSSLKSDKDKEQLKKIIFDEKINTSFIQQELRLITESSKSQTRKIIYKILEKYEANLIQELQTLFYSEYSLWKVNLYKLTRKFEEWMKNSLSDKLKKIATKEQPEFINIINRINEHFSFFTKSLRAKLSDNIYKVIGIKLADEEWKPEFKPLKQPDISVSRAFDTPIELLWFLFPMFLFRRIFRNYFLKQIAYEVEKNIHRLTSNINEIINKVTDSSKEQTMKYILSELDTVEKVLSGEQSKSDEYILSANKLRLYMNNLRL